MISNCVVQNQIFVQRFYNLSSTFRMKSYGLVIDEELQPNRPFKAKNVIAQERDAFPSRSVVVDSTQSYITVVEQSIITQDKPLLKEIIIESSAEQLRNTIAALPINKVSALLSLLEEFIYEDYANTDSYCVWLKEIISRHMGIILSNSQNQTIIARIRKFIQKKVSQRQSLLLIKSLIQEDNVVVESKKFIPKFSYIQAEDKPKEQQQEILEDQEVEEADLMEEEFYD